MDEARLYEQFRELVKDSVDERMTSDPERADQQWFVRCFKSAEQFAREFPSPAQRKSIVEGLRRGRETTRRAVAEVLAPFESNLPKPGLKSR